MLYEAHIYTGPCSVRIPLHQGAGLTAWVQNPGRVKIFSLRQKHLDWLWDTPNLLFSGHRSSSLGTDFDHSPHLVSRLGMNGAVPLLPLYAFTGWTGIALPLTFTFN
jgi:hypothetical protein